MDLGAVTWRSAGRQHAVGDEVDIGAVFTHPQDTLDLGAVGIGVVGREVGERTVVPGVKVVALIGRARVGVVGQLLGLVKKACEPSGVAAMNAAGLGPFTSVPPGPEPFVFCEAETCAVVVPFSRT